MKDGLDLGASLTKHDQLCGWLGPSADRVGDGRPLAVAWEGRRWVQVCRRPRARFWGRNLIRISTGRVRDHEDQIVPAMY